MRAKEKKKEEGSSSSFIIIRKKKENYSTAIVKSLSIMHLYRYAE